MEPSSEPRRRGQPLGPPGRRAARRAGANGPATPPPRPEQPAPEPPSEPRSDQPPTPEAQAESGPQAEANGKTGRFSTATRAMKTAGSKIAGASTGAAKGTARMVRKVTHAQGMGETGLAKLIEMHAVNMAGDACVMVGLAGTLFFTVPSAEARGRVALYLLITMAPFAIVAPLIGPFLDRFRRGRRWAIGSTMAARGFFCWVLAGAVVTEEPYMYALALGCLVGSKAYGVTRATALPRLLPDQVELVTANSRISLAGTIGTAIGAGIAAALAAIGPDWALRFGFVVFIVGTVLAIRLPARVDSSEGEEGVGVTDIGRTLRGVPTSVVLALRANAAFRAFAGFLIMFMAFLLREHPLSSFPTAIQVGVVAGAAGAGALIGTTTGALTRARSPEVVVRALLAGTAALAVVGAAFYGLVTIALVALAAGLSQQLGKLSLDALIQRDVPEHVRTSVFARTETLLQLSWVIGGGIGIVLPLIPQLGLGLFAAVLLGALLLVVRPKIPARSPKPAAPSTPASPSGSPDAGSGGTSTPGRRGA